MGEAAIQPEDYNRLMNSKGNLVANGDLESGRRRIQARSSRTNDDMSRSFKFPWQAVWAAVEAACWLEPAVADGWKAFL